MERRVPAFVGLLAAGCVSASVHRLDQDIRPPRPPDVIEVLEETPEKPYTVIAHIECQTDAVFHDSEDLRRRLVEEAAELGGDALILGAEATCRQPIIVTSGMIQAEGKTLGADVIVYGHSDDMDDHPRSANGL
jgi:hypothetical protein